MFVRVSKLLKIINSVINGKPIIKAYSCVISFLDNLKKRIDTAKKKIISVNDLDSHSSATITMGSELFILDSSSLSISETFSTGLSCSG